MNLPITTPALLFPAVSLILLAYTNRFLALASLIRSLHDRYQTTHDPKLPQQIKNLRTRVLLIRNMQFLGVLSLLLSVLSMFAIFMGYTLVGTVFFCAGLLSITLSLSLSLREIQISVVALWLQLADMDAEHTSK